MGVLGHTILTLNLAVLQVVDIPCKGRGVVTTRPFTKGEFVVEYAGDLVDLGIAKRREKSYSQNQHVGCYMYYFQHKTKNYWYRTANILSHLLNEIICTTFVHTMISTHISAVLTFVLVRFLFYLLYICNFNQSNILCIRVSVEFFCVVFF